MNHAISTVGMAVNECVAFLYLAVNIITNTLHHAVIGRLGVGVVENRLQSFGVAHVLLLLYVADRVPYGIIKLVHIVDAHRLCQVLTCNIQFCLGVAHLFRISCIVAIIVAAVVSGSIRILLSVLNLALLSTRQSLILLGSLHKVKYPHTEVHRKFLVIHDLPKRRFLLLISTNKQGIAPLSPLLLPLVVTGKSTINSFTGFTHFIQRLTLWTTIRQSLCTSKETTHQANTKEGINILVKVEHTSILVGIKSIVTNNQGIFNITCNLLSILIDCSVPLGALLKPSEELTGISSTDAIYELIHIVKRNLAQFGFIGSIGNSLACQTQNRSKVFSKHLGMILDGLRTKSLEICRHGTIFLIFLAIILDTSGFINTILRISCKTIESISRNTSLPSCCRHEHRASSITKNPSTHLGCNIFLCSLLQRLFAKPINGISCQGLLCPNTY